MRLDSGARPKHPSVSADNEIVRRVLQRAERRPRRGDETKVRASAVLGRENEAVVEFELFIAAFKGHGLGADALSVGPGHLEWRSVR